MDFIERAMSRGRHIIGRPEIDRQTWGDFLAVSAGKKVILFGAGTVASIYFEQMHDGQPLSAVVDNDENKWGVPAEEFIPALFQKKLDPQIVEDPAVIRNYNPDDVVVVIASVNYHEEILAQVESWGVCACYLVLTMEANRRLLAPVVAMQTSAREDYISACLKEDIQQKKIIIFGTPNYTGHAKYIVEQLLVMRSDLDIVLVANNAKESVPKGVRVAFVGNWKKIIYEFETAHIWIVDTTVPSYIVKREGQIYIHTKHWASVTLKRFYLDATTITDIPKDVEEWRYNSRCMDYIMVGSDFDEESCRRGFEFEKEFVRVGSPRTDAMFRGAEMKKKVCACYQIDEYQRILLYAPTYRYMKDRSGHVPEPRNIELDYDRMKAVVEKRWGGEWTILLRLHPMLAKVSKNVMRPHYVVDVSEYSDGEELAAACDIMISDYSSIMFEPAFVRKPVFLFALDREDYIDKEYDLLIDYDTLPFPIAESNEELAHKIESFDYEAYVRDVDAFMEKYGVHEDGHASERAARFISDLIDGKRVDNPIGGTDRFDVKCLP